MPNFIQDEYQYVSPPHGGWVFFLLLILAASMPLRAQERPAVSGAVANSAGEPIEFATVTLHRTADSTVVKTEFSDAKGAFRLEGAAGGHFVLSVAQVGYGRYWGPAFEMPANGLAVPLIKLGRTQATALKEVTVTARKPLFEHLADRTVVNVAESPTSAGSTALDVLARSPGVTVDANNNVGLRGRQGVLVVIDGKRVPLTNDELGSYLRSLSAEQVQTIELITNPPAQYDAQGGAGVIAINLKKDQRLGTNGSANASYGRGEYGKFVAGLTLNYRSKNINLYGTYSDNNRRDFARQAFYRQYAASAALPEISSVIVGKRVLDQRSHSLRLGADLTLSKRSLLGLSLSGLLSQTTTDNTSESQFYGSMGLPGYTYRSRAVQDISRPNGSANVNFRHTFADSAAAATLTADADFARYKTTRGLTLNTYFQEPPQPAALLTGDQGSNLSIGAVKVDFSQPLPHRARLEMGVKATRVTSDNNVAFFNDGVYNSLISNHFYYYENVNAAYVNLRGTAAKTALQAGLRAEQTNIRTEITNDAGRERQYTQLFPSASVQRTFNERHKLALALARRIDRPSYGQLNPLRAYFDAVSYRAGNPDLVAQTSYNLELTHTYRQHFTTTFTYAHTKLPIVTVVQPSPDGGRLVVNRDVNLSSQAYYALTLSATLEPAKWWSCYANGVFYYSRFQGELAGTVLDRHQPACLLTAGNTLSLPHGWGAEVSGTFQSGEIWGFEHGLPRGQMLAGVQKSFWEKQGTLRLNVSDILYTARIRSTSIYDNFAESFVLRQDTQVATVAFTYRFGNSKVAAARKRAAGADEELRRAAGQ